MQTKWEAALLEPPATRVWPSSMGRPLGDFSFFLFFIPQAYNTINFAGSSPLTHWCSLSFPPHKYEERIPNPC